MKKTYKALLSLLLVMVFTIQFAGGLSFAEDAKVSGKEALVFELFIPNPDKEAEEKLIPVSAEQEAELLNGKAYSVVVGHDEEDDGSKKEESDKHKAVPLSRMPGSVLLNELLKEDLVITPPEGFIVAEAYLRGDALKENQKPELLPLTAEKDKTVLTLKAGALAAEDEDDEDGKEDEKTAFIEDLFTTFSSADPKVYTLVLVFAPVDSEKDIVVTELTDENSLGVETKLKPGEKYTAAGAPEDTETKHFVEWQVRYENGATLALKPGEKFVPFADCQIVAQWMSILTITANAPVQTEAGFAANGYSLQGELAEGDRIDSVELTVSEQDGKYFCTPSEAVIKNNGKDVTDQYVLRYAASEGVDKPADPPSKIAITITAKTPVYDAESKQFVHNGYELSGTLNDGDALASLVIAVNTTEDGKAVAVPSGAVIKNGDTDNTANYEIAYKQSEAAEPPAPEKTAITITAKTPVYDAESKQFVHNGYELSGTLNDGDALASLVIAINTTEDGKAVAVPSGAVIKNGDTDNTANYEITYKQSEAAEPPAPEKIAITIRSKDRTAEYNGSPILAEDYEITSGELAEGDTIEVTYQGGSTNVTEAPAASGIASVVIKDKDGVDVTQSKYSVTIDNENAGKVTVTKHTITITAITGSVTTNGNKVIKASDCGTADKVFQHGYKAEGLLSGHELRGSFVLGSGKETFVTSIDKNAVRIVDVNNADADVTANYDIKTVDGKLTINVNAMTNVPVVVTVKDQTWTYDGTAHMPDQTQFSISGLLDGDVATVTLTVKLADLTLDSVTNAGTYTIVPIVTIKDKNGAAVSSDKYKISAANATLTVKKYDLTLEAVSASKVYDGKALVNNNVKATSLVSGHKFREKDGVKFNVTDAKGNLVTNGVINVGTYTKKVTEVHIVDAKGNDVTENYNITKVDGKLTITPGVTSQNDSNKVKTGDESNSTLYIVLIVACVILLGAIAALVILQNRKKNAFESAPEFEEPYMDADAIPAEPEQTGDPAPITDESRDQQ